MSQMTPCCLDFINVLMSLNGFFEQHDSKDDEAFVQMACD